MPTFNEDILTAFVNARDRLLAERRPDGPWEGRLSSSALATAVAVAALDRVRPEEHRALVAGGLTWLAGHVNRDGGWGDSPQSASNLSTTLLVWAALQTGGPPSPGADRARAAAEAWLARRVGGLDPESLVRAVLSHYGEDRTFSTPILALCALADRLGPQPEAWNFVPQLPFELALAPRALMGWLRLSVVSYAMPALIAVGLVRHRRWRTTNRFLAALRDATTRFALKVLIRIQPAGGGFLEAAPLTGFVALSLAGAGLADHPVAGRAVAFLRRTVRPDGSWSIDTDLATWVTTLAVNAPGLGDALTGGPAGAIRDWILDRQHLRVHPYTGAAPGGWAWTDRAGGVPDADDTAGALLALRRLGAVDWRVRTAAQQGIRWMCDLQNRDGGWPTFCRGWGRLPFDRSCPDLTAHALRALDAWYDDMDKPLRSRMDDGMAKAVEYLDEVQREDGAWLPLWFGNEAAPDNANPAFGTAQVLIGLHEITPGRLPDLDVLEDLGVRWLRDAQNRDGGWGGAPGVDASIEETALAVRALAAFGGEWRAAARRGAAWLLERTRLGTEFPAAPIGLYFASLWYSERLYPLIFTVGALGRFLKSEGRSDGML